MLAVRLPKDIENRLNELAKLTGRTKTYYVKEAIIEHLQDLEDAYIAEKRLEEIRSGKSKTISLEEVLSEYGLES